MSNRNTQQLVVGLPLQNLCFQLYHVLKVNTEVECFFVALDVVILMSAAAGVSNVTAVSSACGGTRKQIELPATAIGYFGLGHAWLSKRQRFNICCVFSCLLKTDKRHSVRIKMLQSLIPVVRCANAFQ